MREVFENYSKMHEWAIDVVPSSDKDPYVYLRVQKSGLALYEPLVIGMNLIPLLRRMFAFDNRFSTPEEQGVFSFPGECSCCKKETGHGIKSACGESEDVVQGRDSD